MRVAIFSDTYNPQVNGVVTVINILKKGLEERGHEVFVYTVSHPDAPKYEERVFRVPSVKFPKEPQHRLALIPGPKIIKDFKNAQIDIIHSHTPFTLGHTALAMAKMFKVPVVHTFHTYFEEYRHYLGPLKVIFTDAMVRFIARTFCNFHDAVISPSKKMERLLKSYGVRVPIELVPNGVDLEPFQREVDPDEIREFKMRYGIKKGDFVVVFVGRMAPEKSVDKLLENMKKVIKKHKNAKLLLVGDGPNRRDYEEYAWRLGIRKNVIFTGYVKWPTEVAKAYKAAHVFSSASHTEVHPMTFIEAAASGLPLVAYRDPSIEGVLIENLNGFSFTSKDSLFVGILRLVEKEFLRRKMAERSHEIAKRFSADKFVSRMEDLYHHYIERKKKLKLSAS